MWRAVLRSMYSSGLNPLTSPAILQSKTVVSKCVIRPIPETPSIRFDQTVSTSLPIGVMKPMPVTATRRPLELDVMRASIRTPGPISISAEWENGWADLDTVAKIRLADPKLEQLSDLQGKLQPRARRGNVQVSTHQLVQLVQPVEDRGTVEP